MLNIRLLAPSQSQFKSSRSRKEVNLSRNIAEI